MSNYLVSRTLVKNRAEGLVQFGMAKEQVEELLGCAIGSIENEASFFHLKELVRLEELAIRQLGISEIGILLSRECTQHKNSRSGLLGVIAAGCSTIGEAFFTAVKYSRLLSNGISLELHDRGTHAEFIYKRIDPTLTTLLDTESSLIDAYDVLKNFGDIYRVEFEHSKPPHCELYASVFDCPVVCQSSQNKILFDKAILQKENPVGQPYTKGILMKYAHQVLEEVANEKPFTNRVKELVLEHLSSGRVSAEFIAQRLNISRQVLYRRMKEEDTSFKLLLEEIRKEIATREIASKAYSLSELALLLGFSELSSFSRAYKKWFNKSPSI